MPRGVCPSGSRNKTFFLTNYMRPDLRIVHLAQQLCISESRLAHILKDSFGLTFVQLLTHRRLRRACELLKQATAR